MCVVGLPALGATLVPLWQETQVAPPRLLWSTLAPVHLVKLAVVAGVWQVSQAAVVTMCVVGLPAFGATLVPLWQLAQGVAATTRVVHNRPAPLGVVRVVAGVWQVSHAAAPIVMWLVDKPAWGGGAVPLWQLEQVAPPRLLWSTLAPVHW